MAKRADLAPSAIRTLGRADADYPRGLLDLSDPPDVLHVLGTWPASPPAIAIVGARAATSYGLEFAARLAADLARLGSVVVSGLAYGIDAAAHRGALAAGGATVAILPGGLGAIVPPTHEPLAREIARRGALLSEHEYRVPPYRGSFLSRNRLIAAFARIVVVVEARERSGALNTAAHARRLGRPVLAVPGDVARDTSRGCHALLRSGAGLCEGAADVVAALETEPAKDAAATPAPRPRPRHRRSRPAVNAACPAPDPTSPAPQRVLASLAAPRTAESCAQVCGLSLEETQRILLELEWARLVRCEPGARWTRRREAR